MLRATSEMAVAIIVRSLPEKPATVAISRPCWRAVTMSASRATGTITSLATIAAFTEDRRQHLQRFVQIEGGGRDAQRQAELHHRHRHVRLDADDHRLRAAQSG